MRKLLLALVLFCSTAVAQPSPGNRTSLTASISGGTDVWKSQSVTGTVASIKESEGQVYGVYAWNNTSCRRYLKLFGGKASEITLGTTIPALTIRLMPGEYVFIPNTTGLQFPTGISAACTNYPEDASTSAASANECVGSVFYK